MAEVGARPQVSSTRRRALRALESFFTPLLPDDYLEIINPLWSTRELRGRIERVERETGDAVTLHIRPGHDWPGHQAGQYLRIGVVVDGIHHWRAYSLTSDPDRPDGWISITPKCVDAGVVSPWLVRHAKPGAVVRLGGVEGTFTLPDPAPRKLLFVSAGSGVTPIMAMLRHADRAHQLHDAVHLHSARGSDDVIFGDRLREIARRNGGYTLHEHDTTQAERLGPRDLERVAPDWRDREIFASGPGDFLDDLQSFVEEHGDADRFHHERFQPKIGGRAAEDAKGGTITFLRSDKEVRCDGGTPILEAAEEAGMHLPYGCRMGICHTCTGKLASGRLRDLRTGEIHGTDGESVRICVAAPEGDVAFEL